jgi:hypothetical protein
MIKLQLAQEALVISEFLKNQLHQEKFELEREMFQHLIRSPDLTSEAENRLRRAVFLRFSRSRAAIWRELPGDTQWWEVGIEPQDIGRIRFFPRAEWRKVANGSFRLPDVVHSIRTGQFNGKVRRFIYRVEELSSRLAPIYNSSILLIGTHEQTPLTIIDGNHRMAASLLSSPVPQDCLRYFCGLSPQMTRCCWYDPNPRALWRYAKHRLRDCMYGPDAEVERLLSELALRGHEQRISQEPLPEVE